MPSFELVEQIVEGQKTAQYSFAEVAEAADELLADSARVEQIKECDKKINITIIKTPINARAEGERWKEARREGRMVTPCFIYDEAYLKNVVRLRGALNNVWLPYYVADPQTPTELVQKVLQGWQNSTRKKILFAESILAHDEAASAEVMCSQAKMPSPELVKMARNAYGRLPEPEIYEDAPLSVESQIALALAEFDARGVQNCFRWMLRKYGLNKEWKVVVSDARNNICVSSSERVVHIPKNYRTNGRRLIELALHEIGTHVLDAMNAQVLLRKIGGDVIRMTDVRMNEGHAVLNEHAFAQRYLGVEPVEQRLFYILGMDQVRRGSNFVGVAEYLYQLHLQAGCDQDVALDKAWAYTLRIFGGSTQPELATGYMLPKDQNYFWGLQLAKQLVAAGQGQWLSVGVSGVRSFAQVVKFTADDIPCQQMDLLEELLHYVLQRTVV